MKSHPEEFKSHADRWDRVLVEVLEHANEAEIAAIHASIRNIRLGEAHEDMMDELCNGDERRRKEQGEHEYERHLAASLQHMKQQQARQLLIAQQNQAGAYQNAVGVQGLTGYAPSGIWLDESANIGTVTASQPELSLSSTINAIKKALKL
jgi:hypothetical protein